MHKHFVCSKALLARRSRLAQFRKFDTLTSMSVNVILKKTAKADTKGEMNYEFIK